MIENIGVVHVSQYASALRDRQAFPAATAEKKARRAFAQRRSRTKVDRRQSSRERAAVATRGHEHRDVWRVLTIGDRGALCCMRCSAALIPAGEKP